MSPARSRKRPVRRRARKRPSRKGAPKARQIVLRHAASAGVFLMTGVALLAGVVAFYARDLPSTDGLWRAERAPKISLVAADGEPLSVQGESHGAPVRLSELPPHVPRAVLAVEDRNFYHHIGVNPVSIARALLVNASEGEVMQGGSTISQQLAKNLFLSSDRTMKRKIQELLLALWLEHRFTKDEILTLYLNRVYFGAGAYGIDAASYRYFGKPARKLSIGEAAVLAGLLKAPSRYSPTRNPGDAGQRGRLVIDAMVAARFLSEEAAVRARAEPVRLAAARFASAPYFVDYILAEAADLARGVDADLVVQTTFDPRVQEALEAGVTAGVALSPVDDDVQAAAVIVDRTGAVRAMVGGRDYRASQFNRAVAAQRQPGSAFKPFVFLAGIEAGFTPQDHLLDAPVQIDAWRPGNYGGKYYGEVTLTEALARSLNSATIRLQERVGRAAVRQAARRAGLPVKTQGPSLALGVDAVTPLELAGAYVPFANNGYRVAPYAIESIRTVEGELVYRRDAAVVEVAASLHGVETVNAMLRAVVDWGTGRAAAISGFPVAGKTGTTQDSRDAWFAGHAGGLVGVVWIGRDDNKPVHDMVGGKTPAVIWREAMSRALDATAMPEPAQLLAPLQAREDPIANYIIERS
ncbi:MAG: PBP1A family penicillin-binding protein [Pseudomonadota bacterium]|nr:PBP1A family penicillin-binding protein [Pseudomonadota bacterium]